MRELVTDCYLLGSDRAAAPVARTASLSSCSSSPVASSARDERRCPHLASVVRSDRKLGTDPLPAVARRHARADVRRLPGALGVVDERPRRLLGVALAVLRDLCTRP